MLANKLQVCTLFAVSLDMQLCKWMCDLDWFQGVLVVSVQVRFSLPSGSSSVHTIFCQRHVVRQKQEQLPPALTLFSLGWPPYCNTQCLEELFSRAGQV